MKLSIIKLIANKLIKSSSDSKFLKFSKIVAILGSAIGSFAVIVAMAILGGYESALINTSSKFSSHILFRRCDREPIRNIGLLQEHLKRDFKDITATFPIYEQEGLVKSDNFVDGVFIRDFHLKIDNYFKFIAGGEFSSPSSNEAIIGAKLAKKLKKNLGEEITLYTLIHNFENQALPKIEKFKICGIYESKMSQYDETFVFIGKNKAQDFFNLDDNHANGVGIYLNDINKSTIVGKSLDDTFGLPFVNDTIFSLQSAVFSWLDLQKKPIPIILGLIGLVAALNIISTLLIATVEKTKTIGIMRALGLKKKYVLSIFAFQGFSLGFIGSLIGAVFALVFSILQSNYKLIKLNGELYFFDYLPISINYEHYLIALGTAFCLTLLATITPGIIASKITPLKAIRFK